MVKKVIFIGGIVLLLLGGILIYMRAATKKHSPSATVKYKANGYDMSVKYCRPYKKGRTIFGPESTGALQPYGKYWRLGANEATTFTTQTDLLIQQQLLKKGTYAIYAIPGADLWTIAFNNEYDRWGATAPAEEQDVLRVECTPLNNAPLNEQLEISFSDSNSMVLLNLHWDNTKVSLPLHKK